MFTKKFFKTFSLAEYTEPTEATMENGVLKIKLKQELPEEKKPEEPTGYLADEKNKNYIKINSFKLLY